MDNDCNEIFLFLFSTRATGRLFGDESVFEIVTNTVHARVDEEGWQIRALLPSEMEIIAGRNLVRKRAGFLGIGMSLGCSLISISLIN